MEAPTTSEINLHFLQVYPRWDKFKIVDKEGAVTEGQGGDVGFGKDQTDRHKQRDQPLHQPSVPGTGLEDGEIS